jgi:hypothetical protein
MNPDIDWHRHRAASKRRVRVRFEAHLFVPGFLSVGNYNTTLSSDSLETGTGSSNSLCSAKQSGPARFITPGIASFTENPSFTAFWWPV